MTLGIVAGVFAYLLVALVRSTFRVDEGHLAVVTRFGAALVDSGTGRIRLHRPGLHWKAPWDRVLRVSMMERTLDLSGETHGHRTMADDGTVLRLDSVFRFVPNEEHLEHYLFGMRSPERHVKGFFACILRSKIANFRPTSPEDKGPASLALGFTVDDGMGSYALIRRERPRMNQRIQAYCKEQFGPQYGITFRGVDITDILPPDELRDALNAVIGAQAEAGTAYYRAESDARHRLIAAEEGVAIAKLRAAAVETEINELGAFLRSIHRRGELGAYVARRRAEVLAESRTSYVKEAS
ncbi:MAG: SPFH domain-containing protein [Polyangiaceae bacterium]